MITNYFTLRYIASSLAGVLPAATVREAFSQESGVLILDCAIPAGALVVSCVPRSATLFLNPKFARAKRNTATVLRGLSGRTISSVSLHPSDRIISLDFVEGLQLHILCFGSRPNALLVDSSGTVCDAFLEARKLTGSAFQLPPGREDFLDAGRVEHALADVSAPSMLHALRACYPAWGEHLLREVLARAGVHPGLPPSGVQLDDAARVRSALLSVARDLASPVALVYPGALRDSPLLSVAPLTHLAPLLPKTFASIHEAVRSVVGRRRSAGVFESEKRTLAGLLQRIIERSARSIAAVEEDLRNSTRRDDYERYGALIMANLHAIERGTSRITLDDNGTPLSIPLDPRRSGAANAQRYFDRAKSARAAARLSETRLIELRSRHARTLELLELVNAAESRDDLRRLRTERRSDLSTSGVARKAAGAPPFPFRVFRVEGGFEVWAGKSSTNNDLLTLRHAKPADLWFHARGAGGAHVILRSGSAKGTPGKRARQEAAAIAAYYSAMKHSRLVPVAMTERKYVRKPKGAAPGSVLVDREEVIFVEPRLPHEPLSEP